ncbi:MAG: sigma-70 family RNA polymerase sigma factor [Phycisphaerales bacterium]|nr:sigma-70 family RNA polymerase sigma factor [Phycisphaerales bacterium]MCB9857064.1 sigma-70 family RNA polymerase sigma factor [Phycisphaerales bacterium]MCB9861809.1 sigma-70 family RNA polymerase sigma factor [Phycisphaerales bacterium]
MEPVGAIVIADDAWIAGLRAGREEAVTALHDRLRKGLGAALGHRSDVQDSDLDDFTQDAVLQVTSRVDTFRGDSKFSTWAMAIAVRVAMTALRRRRWKHEALDDRLEAMASPAAAPSLDTNEARGELLAALHIAINADLTPKQRQVILGELSGIPQVVLADRLGMKPGAIYKTTHDARKKLFVALKRKGFDTARVLDILADDARG